jgi:hypothetical protein
MLIFPKTMQATGEVPTANMPKVLTAPEMKARLFKRFWNKVLLGDECWEWQGSINNMGYGKIQVRMDDGYHAVYAHRVSWFLATGEWPTEQVLHRCDNTRCVRHGHHFQGTQKDNMQDASEKGRTSGGGANKTHCKRGHNLDNAYLNGGKRHCRICRRDYKKLRRMSES